jgi:hypothetical protein
MKWSRVTGESHLEKINVSELREKFTVEYAHGVLRISHRQWSEPPHLAEAYYEEESQTLSLTALTDFGHAEMAVLLQEFVPDLPGEPDVRIHLSMLTFIRDVLKKDITLIPHADHFKKTPEPEDAAMMEKLNAVLQMALSYINKGVAPALNVIAKKTGLPVETIADLLRHIDGRLKNLPG